MSVEEYALENGDRVSGGPLAKSRRTAATIIGFGVALIALLWIAVVGQDRFERAQAIEDAIKQNTNLAVAFEQYVARTVQNADATTRFLSAEYAREGHAIDIGQMVASRALDTRQFAAVSIIDEHGHLISTSLSPQPANFEVADLDYFKVHAAGDTGTLFIGKPVRANPLSRVAIPMSRRLVNPDGSFGGVVLVQIYARQFTDFYKDAAVHPLDAMTLMGLDGVIRARRAGGKTTFGGDASRSATLAAQPTRPNGLLIGVSQVDSVRRITSYRSLTDYPLVVVVGASEADILAPLNERRAEYYLTAALISALIIVSMTLLLLGMARRARDARKIEDALERLREAQRVGGIGDWDYNLVSGTIHWSPQVFKMYQRDPATGALGLIQSFASLDEASRVATQRALDLAIETGEPQAFEQCVRLPDGSDAHHQVYAVPNHDAAGQVVRLHGTVQDITARKQLETLKAQLAHVSRVDAMNAMAATLAHELNQPLTAATNYLAGSKRLLDSLDDAAPNAATAPLLRDGLSGAERQIMRAGDIIRGIREMISNPGPRYKPISVLELITEALAFSAMAKIAPSAPPTVRVARNARWVRADKIQIQQVLMNLIRNACEAMHDSEDAHLTVTAQSDKAGHVVLCVADTGGGISDDAREKLFSTFATTKENGLGLGLSISRTIIESHGGRIWAEDSEDGGTRVCFTIPGAKSASDMGKESAPGDSATG